MSGSFRRMVRFCMAFYQMGDDVRLAAGMPVAFLSVEPERGWFDMRVWPK